jgi:hypothetical protein
MFKYLKRSAVLFFSIFAFGTLLGSISSASDFQSPRTAALGGAGHAGPLLNDAIYLNPSYTSFIRTHGLSYNFLTYRGETVETPDGLSDYYCRNWNVSVLDGSPGSLFQAGVGFTRRNDASLLHIGASKNILERYGIGVGGKFIFPQVGNRERVGETNFSTTALISNWLQTAFIVDNILESAKDRGYYREYTLGTKINIMSIVLLYIDPHWVPTLPGGQDPWGYEAGIEFPFTIDLFLRAGMYKNSMIPFEALRGNGFGFGAGWLGPRLSLDYSFSRVTSPIPASAHQFGATLFF